MDICPHCGLPKDACICQEMSKQSEHIKIFKEKRRFGKFTTIISGIETDAKEIGKKLKAKLACGGTIKDNKIELQGSHVKKIKPLLIGLGFDADNIEEH